MWNESKWKVKEKGKRTHRHTSIFASIHTHRDRMSIYNRGYISQQRSIGTHIQIVHMQIHTNSYTRAHTLTHQVGTQHRREKRLKRITYALIASCVSVRTDKSSNGDALLFGYTHFVRQACVIFIPASLTVQLFVRIVCLQNHLTVRFWVKSKQMLHKVCANQSYRFLYGYERIMDFLFWKMTMCTHNAHKKITTNTNIHTWSVVYNNRCLSEFE